MADGEVPSVQQFDPLLGSDKTLLADPPRAEELQLQIPQTLKRALQEMNKDITELKLKLADTRHRLQAQDRPIQLPEGAEVKVFQLQTVSSERMTELLRGILDSRPSRLAHDQQANVIVMAALPEDLAIAEAIITRLDGAAEPASAGRETRVFRLQYAEAQAAYNVLRSMLNDTKAITFDERTNSLLISTTQEEMKKITAILEEIDTPQSNDAETPGASDSSPQSLVMRIYWLADGLPVDEGAPAAESLPESVVMAVGELGLREPRLIALTANSLAFSDQRDATQDFVSRAPALLFGDLTQLQVQGQLERPESPGDSIAATVNLTVEGVPTACSLNGSITAPLGHYTVLGTANAVFGIEPQNAGRRGSFRGGGGREFMGRGEEGGAEMGEAAPERTPKSARFAFVVQIVEGKSYAAEGGEAGTLDSVEPQDR